MAGEPEVPRSEIVEVRAGDDLPGVDAGNSFREFISSYIGWIALIGIVVAVIGFVLSLVTLAEWASALLFAGLGVFCVAGMAARHDNSRRLGAPRMPPQRVPPDLEL